jgi:hypothetical protein
MQIYAMFRGYCPRYKPSDLSDLFPLLSAMPRARKQPRADMDSVLGREAVVSSQIQLSSVCQPSLPFQISWIAGRRAGPTFLLDLQKGEGPLQDAVRPRKNAVMHDLLDNLQKGTRTVSR